jgi:hypothetical protein
VQGVSQFGKDVVKESLRMSREGDSTSMGKVRTTSDADYVNTMKSCSIADFDCTLIDINQDSYINLADNIIFKKCLSSLEFCQARIASINSIFEKTQRFLY